MTEYQTLTGAAAALRRGETTATELVEAAIARADAHDETVGVFITRFRESALAAASTVDEKITAGGALGSLEGIPLGIKDIISDAEGPTTAQSLILDPKWGERIGDAVVVSRLKAAGGIVVGKTTTMEFACGVPDPSKPFPQPLNPWDLQRSAGGSSSGSGSGVATGMFLGALGTDTGGSIRIPAAYNGITGLKPTFGRVPKSGVVPLAYTLDHVGPMARSAADCALLLSVIAGGDPSDPYSSDAPVDDYVGALTGDLTRVRVGVDDFDRYASGGIEPLQPERFKAALALLEEAGAEIVPIELPMYHELTAIDLIVIHGESHVYHRSDLMERWDDYGQAARILCASGDVVSAADYLQAQRVRRIAQEKVAAIFDDVDLIITPTGHRGPGRMSAISGLNPLGELSSLHTPYWAALGNPTLAVPIGLSANELPLSMSISGRHWDDALVLRAGDAFQRRSSFHLECAPLRESLDHNDVID